MAFNLNYAPMYVKGTADIWAFNMQTGDVAGYSNKLDTSTLNSTANNGEIRAGLAAPVVINLPDSASLAGEVTAQDFSLQARQFQTGGNLAYNGTVMVQEQITATGTTLTVTDTPVAAYGEPSSNPTYSCYVGTDGVNYQVNPTTKQIVNFTAEEGQTYCVSYFIEAASAQELTIPTVFQPGVYRVMIRMAVYMAQGTSSQQSSFAGWLYVHIPRAQFIDGDGGVNGSQTTNATTSWKFTALSYNEADVTCSVCAQNNSVLGYMVFAPCDYATAAVTGLAIVGGGVTVAEEGTQQVPVLYIMADGTTVTPNYSDLTFESKATGTATVSPTGLVTGAAEGSTTINVSVTAKPSITAICPVTVTAAT